MEKDEKRDPVLAKGGLVGKYTLLELIKSTKQSFVFKALVNSTNRTVAIKFINAESATGAEHEIEMLKMSESPYIVKAIDIFDFPPFKCVVMPLCKGAGCIGKMCEDKVREIIKVALNGLEYLHSKGIWHRDIKVDNLLISEDHFYLGDLGFAKKFGENDRSEDYLGTLGFAAPEIVTHTPYTNKIDIWSLGVTMYTLLSGTSPFPLYPEESLRRCIEKGAYFYPVRAWKHISPDAKNLIDMMLKVNPEERISAKEALKHPWITGKSCERKS